jgi:dTDP-4-dehydrorhamnose reductase
LLVTGANGQVGWELKHRLAPLGDILARDRKECDLSRLGDLSSIIRAARPDVIVNAAAYTAVDKAEHDEEIATLVNGTAVGVLAEEARKIGALLIHYSTDYVFDGAKNSPYSEDDPPNPINAYGRSKLAGERALSQSGADYLILRTCWIFSARGHNFLRTILRLAQQRDELRIVADQISAPTWARHLAEATATIVQHALDERMKADFASEILHVTAGGATSWCGFTETILDQAMAHDLLRARPKVHPIASSEYPLPAARPKNSRLAGERLRDRFGITLPEWHQGLALCIKDWPRSESASGCIGIQAA